MDNNVTDTPEQSPTLGPEAEQATPGAFVETPEMHEADLRKQRALLEWRLTGQSLSEEEITLLLPTTTMLQRVLANHPGLTAETAQKFLDAAGY
jgi:hypothetical protein